MRKILFVSIFIFLPLFPIKGYSNGVIGFCDESDLSDGVCTNFIQVDNLSDELQTLDKEDALIYFSSGLFMWTIGLGLGSIVAAMKKAR